MNALHVWLCVCVSAFCRHKRWRSRWKKWVIILKQISFKWYIYCIYGELAVYVLLMCTKCVRALFFIQQSERQCWSLSFRLEIRLSVASFSYNRSDVFERATHFKIRNNNAPLPIFFLLLDTHSPRHTHTWICVVSSSVTDSFVYTNRSKNHAEILVNKEHFNRSELRVAEKKRISDQLKLKTQNEAHVKISVARLFLFPKFNSSSIVACLLEEFNTKFGENICEKFKDNGQCDTDIECKTKFELKNGHNEYFDDWFCDISNNGHKVEEINWNNQSDIDWKRRAVCSLIS